MAKELGDLIVRLYESTGGRASTEVVVDLDAASVRAADLLERPGEPVAHSVTGKFMFSFSTAAFSRPTLSHCSA